MVADAVVIVGVWWTSTRTRTKELLVVVIAADDLKRLGAVQCIVCDGVSEGNNGWVREWRD